jgi:flagellar hook-basal body complex protein FliE
MAVSNKLIGEQISAKADLSQLGYNSSYNVLLSSYSSLSNDPKFLKQTNNQTCDTTFIKDGNNPINQVAAKSAMSQISMKNLFGLRNKVWSGFVPDEENIAPGIGNKFSGENISSVEIPIGVTNVNTFLVGGGGGAGGGDSNLYGSEGGSGCIVSANCDLTPYGNVDKPRRVFTVAGGGGCRGQFNTYTCGLPGSGLSMIDQDPGSGWGEMQSACVSFPYNWQIDKVLQMHGWTFNNYYEFNIILYFYGDLAKKPTYYFKGRADDRMLVFDITDKVNATKLNNSNADLSNPLLEADVSTLKVDTTTPWVVSGNGPNVNANIRVLRVLLTNAAVNSPCHFALKLFDDAGNEVWNTRKRTGMGFFNFPHQGGRGGTSGRNGNSGGGGGGGGASFAAIESPAYSGNLALIAMAGGGGGGGGYGNDGPSMLPDSRQAQVNHQYITNLKDNAYIFSQESALNSVSKYGHAIDPFYVLKYTDGNVTEYGQSVMGRYDYGGAGGGGGGGGKCGSLYLHTDYLGNPVTWSGISSTGGSNGISGTWTKSLYTDRVEIGDTKIGFSYYPSVVIGRTGANHYNIGAIEQIPVYANTLKLWNGTTVPEYYRFTPGMGGQRTEVGTVQNDGNTGFAYIEWDTALQYSDKSWKIFLNETPNGIIYSNLVNQTGTITISCSVSSPDFPVLNSIAVTKYSGDNITISNTGANTFTLSASSNVYPKILSGIIKVDATHNTETKSFYFGYIMEWKLDYLGNCSAVYVINTPMPSVTTPGGDSAA